MLYLSNLQQNRLAHTFLCIISTLAGIPAFSNGPFVESHQIFGEYGDFEFKILSHSAVPNEAYIYMQQGNLWLLDEELTTSDLDVPLHPITLLLHRLIGYKLTNDEPKNLVPLAREILKRARESEFHIKNQNPAIIRIELTDLEGLEWVDFAFQVEIDSSTIIKKTDFYISKKILHPEDSDTKENATKAFTTFVEKFGEMLQNATRSIANQSILNPFDIKGSDNNSENTSEGQSTTVIEGDLNIGNIEMEYTTTTGANNLGDLFESVLSQGTGTPSIQINNKMSILENATAGGNIQVGKIEFSSHSEVEKAIREKIDLEEDPEVQKAYLILLESYLNASSKNKKAMQLLLLNKLLDQKTK